MNAWNREEKAEKAEDDAEEATISSSDYMLHTVRTKKALCLGNDSFPKTPMPYFLVRERLLNEVVFARR